jgi:hypothetical protein
MAAIKPTVYYKLSKNEDQTGILNHHKINEITAVYDEEKYYVFTGSYINGSEFSSFYNFKEWYLTQPKKHFHEVIFGDNIQRLKFDIDSSVDEFGDKIKTLNTIIDCIVDELNTVMPKVKSSRSTLLLTDSCGGNKVSFHIIVKNFTVNNNEEAALFTSGVLDRLNKIDSRYRNYIDAGVNSKLHNLRIYGSSKVGSDRVKGCNVELNKALGVPIHSMKDLASTMITLNPSGRDVRIPDRVVKVEKDYESIESIPDYIHKHIKNTGFNFRCIAGSMVITDRIIPSFCNVCRRLHDKDNTMIITRKDNLYYERCRHYSPDCGFPSSILIVNPNEDEQYAEVETIETVETVETVSADVIDVERSEPKKVKPFVKLTQIELIDKYIKSLANGAPSHETTKFESVPNKQVYSNPAMLPYNVDYSMTAIMAQMGVGKTVQLKALYESNFSSTDSRAVIVSFRRTFTQSIQNSFNTFTAYNDISGDIDLAISKKIIIQVESLHRLRVSKVSAPDVLILDEIESILDQMTSNLHKCLHQSFSVFCWLIKHSKKLVIMDANLSDRTYNTLTSIRGINETDVYLHWNQFKKAAEDKYEITTNHKNWINKMSETLNDNKRIVVATNSKTEADAIYSLIYKLYPNLTIQLYTAETDESVKKEHFSNVNKYWNVDVLIYTSVITAGCSYVNVNFDYLFAYMTDSSCNVEACRQMCARVRNISTKTMYICFKSTGISVMPTTEPQIRALIQNRTNMELFTNTGLNNIELTLTDEGLFHYQNTPYFNLWMQNMILTNLSRNNFICRYIKQIYDTGASLSILTITNKDEINEIQTEFKAAKAEIKELKQSGISEAVIIDESKAAEIRSKLDNLADVSKEDKQSYEKYRLSKAFNIKPELVDFNFVETYDSKTKVNFDNLTDILRHKDLKESLEHIKKEDKEKLELALQVEGLQASHLLRNTNNYSCHLSAIKLIDLAGYDDIINDKVNGNDHKIKPATMTKNCKDIYDHIINPITMSNYDTLFKLKKTNVRDLQTLYKNDKEKFTSAILKWVNVILKAQYGIRIHKKRNDYILDLTNTTLLFNITGKYASRPEDDKKPTIECLRL